MRVNFKTIKEVEESLKEQLELLMFNYSKILPIRLDLYFKKGTRLYQQMNDTWITSITKRFCELMLLERGVIGYCWVMEIGDERGVHFHVMLYVNGQYHQSPVSFLDYAINLWDKLTYSEGTLHACDPDDKTYKIKALKMINHFDIEAKKNLIFVLKYFSKLSQKYWQGYSYEDYGLSEVEEKSNRGRPRGYRKPLNQGVQIII